MSWNNIVKIGEFTPGTRILISTRKTPTGVSHHITWSSIPIPFKWYRDFESWVITSKNYGLPDESLLELKTKLLNKLHSCNVTLGQAGSIRNIVVKSKIISGHWRMNKLINTIADKYAREDILTLSQSYDFPPVNLLRGIFLHIGYAPCDVYNIFTNRVDPTSILSNRDYEQYKLAEHNDAESIINQKKIADIAAANELLFVEHLTNLGIAIKTQNDLTAEQIAEHGRAVLTPDVLFIDPVYINDKRIYWIDFKDYVGTKTPFLLHSNMNQAAKYADAWGPGAVCYRFSFVDNLIIPDAITLDASILPIKWQNIIYDRL